MAWVGVGAGRWFRSLARRASQAGIDSGSIAVPLFIIHQVLVMMVLLLPACLPDCARALVCACTRLRPSVSSRLLLSAFAQMNSVSTRCTHRLNEP